MCLCTINDECPSGLNGIWPTVAIFVLHLPFLKDYGSEIFQTLHDDPPLSFTLTYQIGILDLI